MNKLQKSEELGKNDQLVFILNRQLADNINLKLQAKQAHWNIKGPNFSELHLLFDKVAEEADINADMLAERVRQLGGTAAGTLEEVKKRSQLEEYPITTAPEQYLRTLAESIEICANEARHSIDLADELNDSVTSDLFTEIARGLDKQHWFVSSHMTK